MRSEFEYVIDGVVDFRDEIKDYYGAGYKVGCDCDKSFSDRKSFVLGVIKGIIESDDNKWFFDLVESEKSLNEFFKY